MIGRQSVLQFDGRNWKHQKIPFGGDKVAMSFRCLAKKALTQEENSECNKVDQKQCRRRGWAQLFGAVHFYGINLCRTSGLEIRKHSDGVGRVCSRRPPFFPCDPKKTKTEQNDRAKNKVSHSFSLCLSYQSEPSRSGYKNEKK